MKIYLEMQEISRNVLINFSETSFFFMQIKA